MFVLITIFEKYCGQSSLNRTGIKPQISPHQGPDDETRVLCNVFGKTKIFPVLYLLILLSWVICDSAGKKVGMVEDRFQGT